MSITRRELDALQILKDHDGTIGMTPIALASRIWGDEQDNLGKRGSSLLLRLKHRGAVVLTEWHTGFTARITTQGLAALEKRAVRDDG